MSAKRTVTMRRSSVETAMGWLAYQPHSWGGALVLPIPWGGGLVLPIYGEVAPRAGGAGRAAGAGGPPGGAGPEARPHQPRLGGGKPGRAGVARRPPVH